MVDGKFVDDTEWLNSFWSEVWIKNNEKHGYTFAVVFSNNHEVVKC